MTTIKLNHAVVTKQVSQVKTAVDGTTIGALPADQLGNNDLSFTSKWEERETNLEKTFNQYLTIVKKNLEDTRANVDLLKEQDEAITHNVQGYQPL
ncbi:YwqI/YxiC family protein [Peribacillus sp. NPDC097225]|uniref:YwqI/YxiC family protein n=1 Tax=Peribacillus sp. NPDC097225 TaxID=3364400 RepID=UPI003827292D